MKWLLGILGLTVCCRNETSDLMAQVRTASDDHAREAQISGRRIEEVILKAQGSALMQAAENATNEDRRRVLEEFLIQRVQKHVPVRR